MRRQDPCLERSVHRLPSASVTSPPPPPLPPSSSSSSVVVVISDAAPVLVVASRRPGPADRARARAETCDARRWRARYRATDRRVRGAGVAIGSHQRRRDTTVVDDVHVDVGATAVAAGASDVALCGIVPTIRSSRLGCHALARRRRAATGTCPHRHRRGSADDPRDGPVDRRRDARPGCRARQPFHRGAIFARHATARLVLHRSRTNFLVSGVICAHSTIILFSVNFNPFRRHLSYILFLVREFEL